MSWLLGLMCLVAFAYQVAAVLAAARQLRRKPDRGHWTPPVSILKPVYGLDGGFREAIRSHAGQDYPEFEILFAVAEADTASRAEIERLQRELPAVPIRIIPRTTPAPNGKVGALIDLAREARYEVLLVNDSDIRAPEGYLRSVVAPLEDPGVGLVTCLYHAEGTSFPACWEALGINTDFAPSVLVAPLAGIREFALGSTMVFRRGDLERTGGFGAIAAYIADDYQLGKRIASLGKRVHLSTAIVETGLQGRTWRDVWAHQVRWHRTIRLSRGAYIGMPVTMAAVWMVAAVAAGMWIWAASLAAARLASGLLTGWGVLRSDTVRRFWPLIPLRDLWGAAVWVAGLAGRRVRWRDQWLELSADGRIERVETTGAGARG